jgi:hypothetical protein
MREYPEYRMRRRSRRRCWRCALPPPTSGHSECYSRRRMGALRVLAHGVLRILTHGVLRVLTQGVLQSIHMWGTPGTHTWGTPEYSRMGAPPPPGGRAGGRAVRVGAWVDKHVCGVCVRACADGMQSSAACGCARTRGRCESALLGSALRCIHMHKWSYVYIITCILRVCSGLLFCRSCACAATTVTPPRPQRAKWPPPLERRSVAVAARSAPFRVATPISARAGVRVGVRTAAQGATCRSRRRRR